MRNLFLAGAAALALASGATIASAQDAATPSATTAAAPKPADPSWSAEYKTYYETLTPTQKEGWWALSDAQKKQVYDLPAEQRASTWASIEAQIASASPQGSAATTAGQTPQPSSAAAPSNAAPSDATSPADSSTADAMGANPSGAAAPDAASPAEQIQANPRGAGEASDVPPNPATADSAVPPAVPADPSYNAGAYKGALTAPPAEAMTKDYPKCSRTVQDSCVNPGGR